MSDSKDRNNDQLFEDLIDEASSIGSLNIEERNFEDFVPETAAREVVDQKPSRRIFGKRSKRQSPQSGFRPIVNEEDQADKTMELDPESVALIAKSPVEDRKPQPTRQLKNEDFKVISPFGPEASKEKTKSAIELLREEREAEKKKAAELEEKKRQEILTAETIVTKTEAENIEDPEIDHTHSMQAPEAALTSSNQASISYAKDEQKPKQVISRVHVFDPANHIDETNGFSFEKNANESHEDIMGHGEVFEPEHHVAGSLSVKRLNGHEEEMDQNDPSLSSTFTSLNLMGSAAASALLENHQEEEPITLIEEDEEDQIYDPSASLVDDYDYDLYQDRKHFLMSDYKKMEDYLEAQARQGYHYVSHEGKKFFFHKGEPSNEYYEAMYFTKEPVESQWQLWKEQGWEFVHRTEGKKRSDYGWIIFRHPEEPGQFKREIDNNKEKYRFFRKYSNSCRSTLFVLFICMVTSVITAFLQWQFKGYLAGILFCGFVFLVSLYFCIVYARMLTKSRKQAQLLKARIRRSENEKQKDIASEETNLDNDWDEIDDENDHSED